VSLAQQIRDALRGKRTALTCAELLPLCPEAQTSTQIAMAVHDLFKRGEIIREGERGTYRYRALPAGTTARTHIMGDDDSPETTSNPSEAPAEGISTREPEETGTRERGAPRKRRSSAGSLPVPVQSALPAGGTRDATNAVGRDLQLAITDAGVLALRRGDACLYLEPLEVQRMTAFLQRVGVPA
jgi:hypothetical protein